MQIFLTKCLLLIIIQVTLQIQDGLIFLTFGNKEIIGIRGTTMALISQMSSLAKGT